MATNVFALINHSAGKADEACLELLAAARTMFPDATPTALVLGTGSELAAVNQEVAGFFPEVWSFDQEALAYPNAEVIRPLLAKVLPASAVVLMAHSTLGMDLGPGLSVKLGAAYLPDVVGFTSLDASGIQVVRQEYAGQVSTHVLGGLAQGAVITLRSGAFQPAGAAGSQGQIVDKSTWARRHWPGHRPPAAPR